MLPADRTSFLLDDFFNITLTDKLVEENIGTIGSPKGDPFDLSIVPKLDGISSQENKIPKLDLEDKNYRNSLHDRTKNSYDPANKETNSYVDIYDGGGFIAGEMYQTDIRTHDEVKDNYKSKVHGDLDSGRTGRYIEEFSYKAQRAMRNALCKVNLNVLEGRDRPLFITLTLADDIQGKGMSEKCKKALQRFKKKLSKHPEYKDLTGMWKVEFQKNRKAHYHLIVWGVPFVSHEWLAETWHECLYPDPIIREKNKKHLASGSSIGKIHGVSKKKFSKKEFREGQEKVDIGELEEKYKRVKGRNGAFRKASNYLTKYLTKDETDVPDDWENSRFYGYINIKKFKTFCNRIRIKTTKEQQEKIQRAKVEIFNDRKRMAVHMSPNLKFVMKYDGIRLPITEEVESDEYGNTFTYATDELGDKIYGTELDARRFVGGGDRGYEIQYDDDDNGERIWNKPYVTELHTKVYKPELIKNDDGINSWNDVYVGTLVEDREWKPEKDNPPILSFDHNYKSRFVLISDVGEVIGEYPDYKSFPGIKLDCEDRIYSNWSAYGITFEEVITKAYPNCTFELVGSFVTSFNKDNSIKEEYLECKLVIHKQEQMQLEKAS